MSDSTTPWTDYTVHGILQARILEWVPFNFSRGSSQPRSPALQEDSLLAELKGKPSNTGVGSLSLSPADLPDPGIEPGSPAVQADSLPTELERVGWLELRRLRGAFGAGPLPLMTVAVALRGTVPNPSVWENCHWLHQARWERTAAGRSVAGQGRFLPQFFRVRRGWLVGSGSGVVTSSPAAAIWPLARAR